MSLTTYRIGAHLFCHDVRLNTSVETEAVFDHYPTEEEALQPLWPIADSRAARDFYEGCPYILSITEIQPIGPAPVAP